MNKKTKLMILVIGLIMGFIIGQTYLGEARDFNNYSEDLLEEIRDNGNEMISKLDQIAENTRNHNCK